MPESPYRVEFASATASCSSANVWNVSTGPNTSRWTISESFERGVVEERADVLAAPAAADDLVAVGTGTVDEPLDARQVVGMDQRRHRRRVVARVAEHVL